MRTIKNISSISLLLLAFVSCGQIIKPDEQMYLLMAPAEDYITHWKSEDLNPDRIDTTRSSILFLLNKGNLKSIDTINYNQKINTIMPECRHFEEFKFFYIREKGVKGEWVTDRTGHYYMTWNEDNYVTVLDYSGDKIVLRKANADSIAMACNLLRGQSYIDNGQLKYTFSYCSNQEAYHRNVINKFMKVNELDEDIFLNHQYQRTEPSIFYRMSSGVGFRINRNGELVLSFDGNLDYQKWNKVDFQFPYRVDSKRYSNIQYLLKTPACSKEIFFKGLKDGGTDSIATYYIYDKNTKGFDSIISHFKIYEMDVYQGHIGYGTLALNASFKTNKPKEMPPPSRYSNKYGDIPNLQYNTGKFFIWDLDRNDFKVYDMDDLDTELLSIHEDWVYYRIFDEIRKIKLSDLDSRDYKQKTELLLKDKIRVPNIHHVFWAPEMPLKVEWVTAKPKNMK